MKKSRVFLFVFCIVIVMIGALVVNYNSSRSKKSYAKEINRIYASMDKEIFDGTMVGLSSNPYDYINNNKYYNQIVSLGIEAVPDLEKYLIKEGEGLSGYLTALAMQDILDCNIYNITKSDWKTGTEFYKSYAICKADIEKDLNAIICCGDDTDNKIDKLKDYGMLAIPYIDEYIKKDNRQISNKSIVTSAEKDLQEEFIEKLEQYREEINISEKEEKALYAYLR